jgi:hypothetical protein
LDTTQVVPRKIMQTYTGRRFDPRFITVEDICIEDIAAHLSKLCRYNGACRQFYSVAEHSVLVSRLVPEEDQLWGLLHDASEAYLGDRVVSLKYNDENYKAHEAQVMKCVTRRFQLPEQEPSTVWAIDKGMIDPESRLLMEYPFKPIEGAADLPDYTIHMIRCLDPERARFEFMRRFHELTCRR